MNLSSPAITPDIDKPYSALQIAINTAKTAVRYKCKCSHAIINCIAVELFICKQELSA